MEQKKWVLVSVFDKSNLIPFVEKLIELGYSILASGGTRKAIEAAGLEVTDVAEWTKQEPILKHRVVTLHPRIHAGLLADCNDPEQVVEMIELGWDLIHIVRLDFYPLEKAIADGEPYETIINMIDIGGPTMASSASKGGRFVVIDPKDEQLLVDYLENGDSDCESPVRGLCAKADFLVSCYRMKSAAYRSNDRYGGLFWEKREDLPLCYGENKYQQAELVQIGTGDPLGQIYHQQICGNPPSTINRKDMKHGVNILRHAYQIMSPHAPGIKIALGLKHGNPAGAAFGHDPFGVIRGMAQGDELALFGGVVITNFPITEDIAVAMRQKRDGSRQNFDLVLAPEISPEAADVLDRVTGKCRMFINPALAGKLARSTVRELDVLDETCAIRQDPFKPIEDITKDEYLMSGAPLDHEQLLNLLFAGAICHGSTSNTMTLVTARQLTGNGVGQQARVYASDLAVERAITADNGITPETVAWSDSFFPNEDGLEKLIALGVRTVFSTSGSRADQAVIDLAKQYNITLIMGPDELFRGFCRH
ncbi:MAG: hypothetical protein NTZ65_00605 [Candidatus Berkelbacteria bacterium]|nr:hypothetical protein [Candidatus Berkelbacteria bacterium]